MKKTDIVAIYKNLEQYEGMEVKIGGWIRSVRDMKQFGFMVVNDGTCFRNIQIVIQADLVNYPECVKLLPGSSVLCEGKVVATPEAKQPFELQCSKVTIISKTDESYPLQKKGSSFEFLREHAYLRPRTFVFNAVFRVRSEAAFALHQFFMNEGFVHVHTPLLTASDCEGAGELFRVSTQDIYAGEKLNPSDELLGKSAFLSPSCQLEDEALALALGKVYSFGPSFRAEKSYTTKHVTEFWHIEPEMAFFELFDDMDLIEKMIKYVISYLLDKCKDELEYLDQFIENGLIEKLKNTANSEFARISYTDAVKELEKYQDTFKYKISWGSDIQTEHEKCLTNDIFKKPVFVYDYPKEIKAFYMRLNDDGKTVRATDLLIPGIGELCGASEREDRYDVLLNRIKELGLEEESYWWYLNLRKYGSVKHSGFGMGFDRFIMYVTGMKSIKDVIPFPRTPNSCEF